MNKQLKEHIEQWATKQPLLRALSGTYAFALPGQAEQDLSLTIQLHPFVVELKHDRTETLEILAYDGAGRQWVNIFRRQQDPAEVTNALDRVLLALEDHTYPLAA